METSRYPVRFSVDYPDRPLDRGTTLLRIFVAIPILIVLGAVSAGTWEWTNEEGVRTGAAGAGGVLFFGPLLMIVFRHKYPRSLFDFVEGVMRWNNRVAGYALLLVTDVYPPFSLD